MVDRTKSNAAATSTSVTPAAVLYQSIDSTTHSSPHPMPLSTQLGHSGYEPTLEADGTSQYRELKAFALIVGICIAGIILYELTTAL
jgi:hypothetical protein